MRMPRVKYACCKHGPDHSPMRCGFAHCLGDIGIPTSMLTEPRIWQDQTHTHRGHPGIDWFVGQTYTPLQLERLLWYLASEPLSCMPLWAKRLAWYLDYGNREDYVFEGDLGWSEDAKEYFNLDVTYDTVITHKFPFAPCIDGSGRTFYERIFERMSTGAQEYMLYSATSSWRDNGSYADRATGYGKYDRQYLEVHLDTEYLRLYTSDCVKPWWYMVPKNAMSKVFTEGGWAPPNYFEGIGENVTLYEVPLSRLEGVYEDEGPPTAIGVSVFVDGSVDPYRGIAAGCLFSGACISSRASLALDGITGAETSELLGITLGLLEISRVREKYSLFVLMIDSQNAIDHVFGGKAPVKKDGQDLLPCILLARRILRLLLDAGVKVSAVKVARRYNLADRLAKSEMRYRRDRGWLLEEDHWPYPLCDPFKSVFYYVAANRRCPGMISTQIRLSQRVLESLDNLVAEN